MEHIHIEREGAVATIRIDRRERWNSLDVATARDLRKAGLALARDPAVRALVVRGTGGVFCSGADLKYVREGGRAEDLGYLVPGGREPARGYGAVFKAILEYLHSTIAEIRRAPKPCIAAVDGVAAAGGLGLALSCDLVVASERALFEYAYFKTALSGAEGSTYMLPRRVGFGRAMELALLNPRLDAHEAHRLGLVSLVLPTDRFDVEVAALAARLAAGPTASYAAAKQLMSDAVEMARLEAHLDRELEELVRSADRADFAEGLAAFFEKRPPDFEGK